MNLHWQPLKGIPAALVLVLGVSCASQNVSTRDKVVRYQGYYTLGAARSTFMPKGADKTYVVMADDLPAVVYNALKNQPQYPDVSSESGKSVSVFADVEGTVAPDPGGALRFHAVKVFSVAPAEKSYLDSLAKWPPPAHFN